MRDLRLLIWVSLFALAACTPPADDPPPPVVEDDDDDDDDTPPPIVDDDDDDDTPPPAPFALDYLPGGDLIPGSTSVQGDTGVLNPADIAPAMRFPREKGPAFLNSQIFGQGGFGYLDDRWPPVGGSENDPVNFDYPWRDNFCEVRLSPSKHTNSWCPSSLGHQGQDIRPATCENGAHWAVAPERVVVRNVAETHLVNLYAPESGVMYTMLHMDRPLADTVTESGAVRPIQRGDVIEKGERIGRISDVLSKPVPGSSEFCERTGRCTTVHLHFEMRKGVTPTGNIASGKAVNSVSPYESLVKSYIRLVDSAPDGEDWASPVTPPAMSACAAP